MIAPIGWRFQAVAEPVVVVAEHSAGRSVVEHFAVYFVGCSAEHLASEVRSVGHSAVDSDFDSMEHMGIAVVVEQEVGEGVDDNLEEAEEVADSLAKDENWELGVVGHWAGFEAEIVK